MAEVPNLWKENLENSPRPIQLLHNHFLSGNPCPQLEGGHKLSRLGNSEAMVATQFSHSKPTEGHEAPIVLQQLPAQINSALPFNPHSQEHRDQLLISQGLWSLRCYFFPWSRATRKIVDRHFIRSEENCSNEHLFKAPLRTKESP